jgi:hypothetical protein
VNKKRNIRGVAAIGGVLAIFSSAVLPNSVLAQTATPVNDQIKQLQNEIRNIEKQVRHRSAASRNSSTI